MAGNRKKKIIMGTRVRSGVASPTGRPSKVNPALAQFEAGQSTAGARPRPLSAQPALVNPRLTGPTVLKRGNIAEIMRKRNRKMRKRSGGV